MENAPVITRLLYKPGETILKSGDYSIAIYKIVEGEVRVYKENLNAEIPIDELGPGAIVGEMAYFESGSSPRRETVKAKTDAIVDVWHPDMLSSELAVLPSVAKHLADNVIKRLDRTNRLLSKLQDWRATKERENQAQSGKVKMEHRQFYRKSTNILCTYHLANMPKSESLKGVIKDLSKTGMCLEIPDSNNIAHSHKPGDIFKASGVLPNGQAFEVITKIANVRRSRDENKQLLGMLFVNPSEHTNKVFGFFLMK